MQIFLYFDFLALGVIIVLAYRYGLAHFRPDRHDLEKQHHDEFLHLSPEAKHKLLEEAEAKMRRTINQATARFQEDLDHAESALTKQFEKLSAEVIEKEMEQYQKSINKLKEQAEEITSEAKADLSTGHGDLKAKLEEELKAEKQQLISQIDTKLADAVVSFLLETLQHNVDLGAQTAYLTSILEEHKNEFKQGILDESPVTK